MSYLFKKLLNLVKYLWNSPTFTSWANLGTSTLGLLAILPLVLSQFSADEITVYYLFGSVIGIQGLLKLGFEPTFVRLIGFAHGGRKVGEMADLRKVSCNEYEEVSLNQESIKSICSSMRLINRWLACLSFFVLGLLGTLALIRPIERLQEMHTAWFAWFIILFVTCVQVYTGGFSAYLRGANYVALSQRWGALFNIGRITSMILAMIFAPSLLIVVVANQVWVLINILRFWQLCEYASQKKFRIWSRGSIEPLVLKLAWSRSWRTALGDLGGRATQESLGFVYAQNTGGPAVASYLIGMRIIRLIENFSMAPFYSKLPLLNRLRSSGDEKQLAHVAMRGIFLTNSVYVVGFCLATLLGPAAFSLINTDVEFPHSLLWILMGITFFIQRFGANHIQLYTTTNHVVWHITNLSQGVVTIVLSIYLASPLKDLGYALSLLGGALVYALISTIYSYKAISITKFKFEFRTSLLPLLVLLLAIYAEIGYGTGNLVKQIMNFLVARL